MPPHIGPTDSRWFPICIVQYWAELIHVLQFHQEWSHAEKTLQKQSQSHKDIPPELYANSDQTQMVYAPGNKLPWVETGAKQVSLVGTDESECLLSWSLLLVMAPFYPSRQSTRVEPTGLVQLWHSPITMLQWWPGFSLSFLEQAPIGQTYEPCNYLSTTSSHHILTMRRKSLATHHVKRPYGRLMFGPSITQRSFTPGWNKIT